MLGAAILLGLMGSLHCLGMCGPIALALPVHTMSKGARFTSVFLYNFGRILTYACIGLIFGLAGWGLVLSGFQQYLSIALGLLLLLAAFFPVLTNKIKIPVFERLVFVLKQKMGYYLKTRRVPAFFVLGMLNGLLPCGLVYVALAGALASGTGAQGSLFMAAFGFGTIPAMMALPLLGGLVKPQQWAKMKKLIPYTLALFGILLLLRGLDLGIPFISPQMTESGSMNCCH